MNSLFALCLLHAATLQIQAFDLRDLPEEDVNNVLLSTKLSAWVLDQTTCEVSPYECLTVNGQTTNGDVVLVQKCCLHSAQLARMLSIKLSFFEMTRSSDSIVLPDYAFSTKSMIVFVTLSHQNPDSKFSIATTFDRSVHFANVPAYKEFMTKLMEILEDLEKRGMVFLKLHHQDIGTTSVLIGDPVVLTLDSLFPTGFYCSIGDRHNTPQGPVRPPKSWMRMIIEAWRGIFFPPEQVVRTKTLQEELKIRYQMKVNKNDVSQVHDGLANLYYVVTAKRRWSRMSFLSLLKEKPLPNVFITDLSQYLNKLDELYSKLESGNAEEITWEAIAELIGKLPAPNYKSLSSRASQSESRRPSTPEDHLQAKNSRLRFLAPNG